MQFKDVLVSESVKEQLLNQVHGQRISHAQFFLASPGSQAFAAAVALAQYLCCEHPTDTDSCGECPSCKQFAKLSHPDLHLYFPNCTTKEIPKEPDSIKLAQEFKDFVLEHRYHINIEDWLSKLGGENKQASINIRDCSHIVNQNSMRSYMGGYKIYILWCVDRLYHAAAPKLLKTLEEPENQSLFILISEKPEMILSTILSRTQLVRFPQLSDGEVRDALLRDFPDLTPEEALNIAILCEGNYPKALKIHDDNSNLRTMLDHFDLYMNSIVAFARQQSDSIRYDEVLDRIDQIVKEGREYQKQFIDLTIRMLRNILMLNTHHLEMIKATDYENQILSSFNGVIGLKQASLMTEECNKAMFHISRNGNTSLILTDLYFKLAGCLK